MPPRDYDDRRVEVYFGPSRKVEVTKEELAEFIIEEMGLERSDGGPKWTVGVAELVKSGMKAWNTGGVNQSEVKKEIGRLGRKLDQYHDEIENLATNVSQEKSADDLVETARLVYQTEARILEVLCRDEHIGAKSPNYVEWTTISSQTGLDQYIVMYYSRMLANDFFLANLSRLTEWKKR